MTIGVLELNQNEFLKNVKTFFKNDKVRKILFISFLVLLFFLINKYSYSVPTTGGSGGAGTGGAGTGGAGTGGAGTGGTSTPVPTSSDEQVDVGVVSELIGQSVDDFFKMIMTQLAVMIANLSAVVLALCVLFFTIDFLLKVLTNLGNLSLASLIFPNLPSIITFAIIVFLLLPSGQTVSTTMGTSSPTTISANINNYQLITIGTPDMSQLSLMTGFLEMGKQFFGENMRQMNFIKPSDVLSTILTIPFTIWGLAFKDGIGVLSAIMFALLSLGSMFTVIGLVKDMLMAFISYVLIVGLSVILMPFLLFQKTAQIGGTIISNIVNKGLSLAIRLGLIGVVVNIIETITSAIDKAVANGNDSLTMGMAFQTGFVLMIGMFIAGEGGQVADSVLSGRVANLNAGNFIGGAVGKLMGAGATAIVLGKKGMDNFRKSRENKKVKEGQTATDKANTQDRKKMEQNEANVKSATDEQAQAHQNNEVAQDNLDKAKDKLEKAVASGDKNAIAKAKKDVAQAQKVADKTGRELNQKNYALSQTQQNARESNKNLEKQIEARTEKQNTLAEETKTAQKNRQQAIQETREKYQKRAESLANSLGGNGALARNNAGNVIAMGEKTGTGLAMAGGVAGGLARTGVVLGGQATKYLSSFSSNLTTEEKNDLRDEVKEDLSNMAKHFYKDKVNAMGDVLREKTAFIRSIGKGAKYIKNNGVIGSVSNGVNAINGTESMQNLYRDMGRENYMDIDDYRTRHDPTAYKQSKAYSEEYGKSYERIMTEDNNLRIKQGLTPVSFNIRHQDGSYMTVDEIKAHNGIDNKMDSRIKNERASHIASEIRRNGGITPSKFNRNNYKQS